MIKIVKDQICLSLKIKRGDPYFTEKHLLTQICFQGCGGTGKSHLIMVVSKWVEKILIRPGPVKPKVLLLAFIGVASSLIRMYVLEKKNML